MAASSHGVGTIIPTEKKSGWSQILLVVFLLSSLVLFYLFQTLSVVLADRNREEYLISLRENSVIGCSSFWQLNNNILILGDSHSYAGFDFYKLGLLAQSQKISSCTMGGFYFPSLIELLEKIQATKPYPANIIFGLSLRQFTTGADMQKQLVEHHKLIESMGASQQSIFLRVKDNFELGLNHWFAPRSLTKARQKSLDEWQPIIAGLDKEQVDHLFERLDHPSKVNWKKYIDQIEFLQSNNENIIKFCHMIKQMRSKLFLVDIPESPYLQKQYRPEHVKAYDSLIAKLSSCAQSVVRLSSEEWGVDNRHFLNRSLSPAWKFEILQRELNQSSTELKNLAFDLDHLNLIGAQIVTDKMFKSIEKDLNYAF